MATNEEVRSGDTELRARAERSREGLERQLGPLVERSELLLGVVLDARGAVEHVNEAFARAAGVARAEVAGADFVERFVPELERARIRELLAEGVRARPPAPRFESGLVTGDGERRSVLWSSTLLLDGAGGVGGAALLGVDLTERLRLEAELAEQRKLESLGRMAATVAHDFNNALAVISLSIGRGGRRSDIDAAIAYAKELVASLTGYARRAPVGAADVDVDELCRELEPVLAAAVGPECRFSLALGAGGRRVLISPIELRQLVVNMVTNAGEATLGHGGKVELATAAVTRAAPPGPAVEIRIADDGRGMDEQTLARAFDPFFTTKPAGEGTGIGLATCQSTVARAGGAITVDTRPGRGTTFRIVLPAVPAEAEADADAAVEHGSASEPAVVAERPGSARRLLLVEDSPTLGDLISYMLRDAGYDVVLARTLAEAHEAIGRERFGIVVTDLRMPDGRGEDLVAVARERSPETAIIIASGAAAVMNGIDGRLMKPFTPDELKEEISRAVAHRREAIASRQAR